MRNCFHTYIHKRQHIRAHTHFYTLIILMANALGAHYIKQLSAVWTVLVTPLLGIACSTNTPLIPMKYMRKEKFKKSFSKCSAFIFSLLLLFRLKISIVVIKRLKIFASLRKTIKTWLDHIQPRIVNNGIRLCKFWATEKFRTFFLYHTPLVAQSILTLCGRM